MQSVNFYLEEYRPKPLSFDTRFATLLFIILLILFIASGIIQSTQLTKLKQINQTKKQELATLQEKIISMQKELANRRKVDSIDDLLASKQNSLNSYRKILSQVGNPKQQKHTNYSLILQQLSEQPANSIWLTEIKINQQSLSLQGSSTESTAIPIYIDQLKEAATLKRHFDELKVERDHNNGSLINFSLMNGRLSHEE
ncbi:PilN domain-containing protein [Aliikangiella sp. IMCC44359]|uniref:PilN domain-containing protein n=1 Tax=Aliikangiella sp. IMCC44359 TaxID=3459125 RepID=UPI00403B0B75